MKIVLCDDNKGELNTILKSLENYPDSITVKTYDSSLSLISDLKLWDTNTLFLLDIMMPNMNGIELGKMIHEVYPEAIIIFLTSSVDYALEAYQLHAFQYLLKPIDEKELFMALKRSNLYFTNQKKLYPIETSAEIIPVNIQEIYYVEYKEHTLFFYLKDHVIKSKCYRSNFTLSASSLFEHKDFVQTHRAFLVNLKHTKKLHKDHCEMDNLKEVPISRSQMEQVKSKFFEYLLKR